MRDDRLKLSAQETNERTLGGIIKSLGGERTDDELPERFQTSGGGVCNNALSLSPSLSVVLGENSRKRRRQSIEYFQP